MAGLPDNYFIDEKTNLIPTRVATITLAAISEYSVRELVRIGWYMIDNIGHSYVNPTIDKLYTLTSAGVWIARTDTSGRIATVEASASGIYTILTSNGSIEKAIVPATVCLPATDATWAGCHHRCLQLSLDTDGSGVKAATALHTAVGAFYPVVRLKRIISTVAEATTILNFTVSGGALIGPATMTIALVANVMYELNDILLYDATDATSISVAIDSGPISGTIWLEYEYWSET